MIRFKTTVVILFAVTFTSSPKLINGQNSLPEKPNIVFILADDMNRDTWGAYGSVNCKTPNIDKLASEGIRFERAYCAVAMCAPFRQELYSGRSPWRTGTLPNHSKSNPETKSIAHYLRPLGYRVALMGKTHIGPRECYPFEYLQDGGNNKEDRNPKFLRTTHEFITECSKEKTPFCLFIASNDSHSPYTTGDRSQYDPESFKIPPYWIDTPELREELVKYYAEISNFDRLVGMIRKELEKQGLWKSTLLMVCSEQGTSLPFAKWTCYDNGLHTGLIAHWPGVAPPGTVVNELVSMADINPTLVEVAGGNLATGDCDGKSVVKLLTGANQGLHSYVYGAFTNCNIIGSRNRVYPIRVIRNNKFSLIYNPNYDTITTNTSLDRALKMLNDPSITANDVASSWVELSREEPSVQALIYKLHHRPEYELYNIEKDPFELRNEINNPAYSDVA
jgi:N-sulfoglucosamine sulfohydrolase